VTDVQSLLIDPGASRIENGVVVFESDASMEFDEHWANVGDTIPEGKRSAARRFLGPVLNDERIHGVLLDAGCGDGVHAVLLDEEAPGGVLRVGLDVSSHALQAAQTKVDSRWQLVQARLEALPFRDESFDLVYAYGVVAYTENPRLCLAELARVTRRGGLVGIWVAPRYGGVGGAALTIVRALCQAIGRRGTLVVANALVPFLGLLPTASGLSLRSAGWRACREVVLVNISLKRLAFPRRDEIVTWVVGAGLCVISEPADAPVTIWAQRK
jgi:SAM-dependent methyltransferase